MSYIPFPRYYHFLHNIYTEHVTRACYAVQATRWALPRIFKFRVTIYGEKKMNILILYDHDVRLSVRL